MPRHLTELKPIQTITSNTTLGANYTLVLASAASGNVTITLPTAVGYGGLFYEIKRTDSSSNTLTLATTSSQTIDGSTTASIVRQYTAITVISDGSNWIII